MRIIGVYLVFVFCFTNSLYSQQPTDSLATIKGFGGPSSVAGQLNKDDQHDAKFLGSYFDFKSELKETSGFSYGIDFNPLGLISTSDADNNNAASGAFRAYFHWELAGKKSGNTGSLVAKLENRHLLGTEISPQDLGFSIGYSGLLAVPYKDMGWGLTNFYWSQNLLNKKLAFVAGIIDPADYVNVYALIDPWTDFYNLAFSTDPTIPTPDQGLGLALRGLITENIYALGSLVDANGDPTDPLGSVDSFFSQNEYFTTLEVGFMESLNTKFSKNIHLLYWNTPKRVAAEVPSGWGLAFSFSWEFADKWDPFFRIGYANGGGSLWENSVSTGIGYTVSPLVEKLGVGLNWSRPSGTDVNDQYTAEVFCRFRFGRTLTLSPDLQFLIDPALNPNEDFLTVFGLRSRIAF